MKRAVTQRTTSTRKVVIMCHLIKRERRTSELKKLMPNITQKMLTQQLRELEADGVIIRTVYEQVPPKVVYSLSDYGWSLKPILDAMCAWGEGHIEQTGEEVLSFSLLRGGYVF
ncbi:winged helix-turn-helix transcriptional regulator [Exiguobacterium sp.]|uniref:winged helix-turn-helix transcriptional regulator n=1 Tax=Exiguobacterium sp. TaxID=44751 RepID=UPI00391A26B8